MGGPRPLCSCEHLFTIQIEGCDPPTDEQLEEMRNNLDNSSVDTRPARFDGDFDITLNTGDGITSSDEQDDYLDAVSRVIIDTHQIIGWRVESV